MKNYLFIITFILTLGAYADEPTTIKRVRGKAGVAERVESRGKAAKEVAVKVTLGAIIGDSVLQARTAVKGVDTFDAKPKAERKVTGKTKPQPKSKQPKADEIVVKVKKGKVRK